jgi:hypothetical protein
MTLGLAYWILMLLWLVFGLWHAWGNWPFMGGSLLLFVLLLILGWHSFGSPIKGGG